MTTALTVTKSRATIHKGVVILDFTVASINSMGTSPYYSFDVDYPAATLSQMAFEIPTTSNAVITISIFEKDGVATGSVYELVKRTSLSGNGRIVFDEPFANADTTQVSNLYMQIVVTGGSQATGIMPFRIWITP